MDTQNFMLLVGTILLGFFNAYVNIKGGSNFVKKFTLVAIVFSTLIAFAIIAKSFIGV